MYKHILVPVSFDSERDRNRALEVARILADEGAEITLLHVMEQVPAHAQSYMPEGYLKERRRVVESDLQDVAAALPEAKAVVVQGHASRGILDYAERHHVDCIVVASHRPGMQDLLLGSTAAKVVRHAGCAVHVLR